MHDNNSTAHSEDTTKETEPRPADRIHTTHYAERVNPVRKLYAIIDSVTNSIIGGIQIHLNDASAIRTLYDVAAGDTMINKHPLDFDLYMLGALSEDHTLHSNVTRILTGSQINELVQAAAERKTTIPRRAD